MTQAIEIHHELIVVPVKLADTHLGVIETEPENAKLWALYPAGGTKPIVWGPNKIKILEARERIKLSYIDAEILQRNQQRAVWPATLAAALLGLIVALSVTLALTWRI